MRSPVPLRLPNYLDHGFCTKKKDCQFLCMRILNYSKSKNTMIKGVVKNRAQHSQIEKTLLQKMMVSIITKHLKPRTNTGA